MLLLSGLRAVGLEVPGLAGPVTGAVCRGAGSGGEHCMKRSDFLASARGSPGDVKSTLLNPVRFAHVGAVCGHVLRSDRRAEFMESQCHCVCF